MFDSGKIHHTALTQDSVYLKNSHFFIRIFEQNQSLQILKTHPDSATTGILKAFSLVS